MGILSEVLDLMPLKTALQLAEQAHQEDLLDFSEWLWQRLAAIPGSLRELQVHSTPHTILASFLLTQPEPDNEKLGIQSQT